MVRELTTKAFAGPLVRVGFFSLCNRIWKTIT
jgi:hypothetical protein